MKLIFPRQFSILVNDSDLGEIDLNETSKRTTLIVQTFVVRGTPSLLEFNKTTDN